MRGGEAAQGCSRACLVRALCITLALPSQTPVIRLKKISRHRCTSPAPEATWAWFSC